MDKFTNKSRHLAIQSRPLKPIFILTCVSLVISCIVLMFSIGDLGIASLWTNILIPLLALAYHITILILHRGHILQTNETQPQNKLVHPTATIASLVCTYLLAVAWLVPFGILLGIGIYAFNGEYEVVPFGSTILQIVLDAAEFAIVMAVAILSTLRRRAHNWVPIDEVNLSATVRS